MRATGAASILAALIFFIPAGAASGAEKPAAAGLTAVETVLVDGEATGYGTFQSNNQKVVFNKNGIFMTHIRSRNEAYTAQQWRLSRSVDGGRTFSTIFEATHPTNPPVLETDPHGNLFLIRPDFNDGHAYLYRFRADKNYTEPLISAIPGGSAGKYAMFYDLGRSLIYYSAWGATFHALKPDGTVVQSITLTESGTNAGPQYPLFSLAPDGVLHMAWTTVKHNEYLYWDIHHVQTPDGGANWQNMNGAKVTPPFKVDDSGPSDRISLDDEFPVHTWLSNFMEKDGKLHFLYNAQAPLNRQHYVRYDVKTGKREIDIQPEFKGTSIS
ncbi:MAG: BNR-4 repeat-containing protein, partial [Candidatus Latescibacterota bacterium]